MRDKANGNKRSQCRQEDELELCRARLADAVEQLSGAEDKAKQADELNEGHVREILTLKRKLNDAEAKVRNLVRNSLSDPPTFKLCSSLSETEQAQRVLLDEYKKELDKLREERENDNSLAHCRAQQLDEFAAQLSDKRMQIENLMRANKTLEHQLAEHRAEVAELKKQNMTGCSSPAAVSKTKTSTLKAAKLEYKMGTKLSNRTKEMAENCRLNGNRCFGKGQFDKSIDWYTKSLEYEKSSATFANRAQVHIVCNRPSKAILDARAALALDPNHLKARFRLGRAIYLRGAVDALVELEKCRNADPNNEQIRQEIDACQKVLNRPLQVLNISPSSPNASSTEQHSATGQSPAEIKPPHFSFTLLLVRLWLKQILLVGREGNVRHFTKLDQLKPVLLSESDGPIAQIRLEECTVDQPLIGFFRALDPKLLAGGSLELFGLEATEQQFAQFIELFRPISIHFATYAEYPCDLSAALRRLPPIRSAKHLMFHTRYFPGNPLMGQIDAQLVFPSLKLSDVLDWLHSPSAFPSAQNAVAAVPPTPAKRVRLVDVFLGSVTDKDLDPKEELDNVWRCTDQRVLMLHEEGIVDKHNQHASVANLINECHKLFRRATKPFKYTVKVMCKMGCTKPWCSVDCAPEPVRPRNFTNTLGETLRVSVQKVTLDDYNDSAFFPPHDLVHIERFHRADSR